MARMRHSPAARRGRQRFNPRGTGGEGIRRFGVEERRLHGSQNPSPNSAPLGNPWIPDSVKALRRTFDVGKGIKSARLYSTALGGYEMFLNGKRVSDDVLAPGWTDYRERVVYQTYDVTSMLVAGRNAIGALLAPGWYATPLEWFQQPNNYGDTPPALRAQLMIEHTDGSIEWIKTGPELAGDTSHIVQRGASMTARRRMRVADAAGLDHGGLCGQQVEGGFCRSSPGRSASRRRIFRRFAWRERWTRSRVSEPKPGVYVYDFGQNLAGVERLRGAGTGGHERTLAVCRNPER